MYSNAAYLSGKLFDDADRSSDLTVKSCGNYRLLNRRSFTTTRTKGRSDFQLLYIASGQTHFFFDGEDTVIPAGNVIIYRPGEVQRYIYYAKDKPEVFWVHFSGRLAEKLLDKLELSDENVFRTGVSQELNRLFLQIIQELRSADAYFQDYTSLLLKNILLLTARLYKNFKISATTDCDFTEYINFFNEHYNENICIEDYAAQCHVSTSWFIRRFKKQTGITPMQYILATRIANAQSLLSSSEYTISEISSIVGYNNPLYFSRIFKKQTGMAPMEYRKIQNKWFFEKNY